MIAELAGGYVWINPGGNLEIKYYFREITDGKTFEHKPEDVLSYNDVDSYKLSEPITIQRVVYDGGVNLPKKSSEDESLYTLYALNIHLPSAWRLKTRPCLVSVPSNALVNDWLLK